MRSTIACSLAVIVLTVAGHAHAEPTAVQRTMAEGLFKEGKKLLAHGQIAEACDKFASSYQIDQAGGTLLNLGACHELQGKTATAWAEFNDALTMAIKAGRSDRQKAAREHIASLEPKLSRLTLTAAAGAGSVEIKLDGVVLAAGAFGTGIPVDPGEHTASASGPGRVPWQHTVTIGTSESKAIQVPVLVDVSPPPPPAPPAEPVAAWQKPLGLVATGVGVASLGVGIAFGVRALMAGGNVSNECHSGICSQTGMDDLSSGRTAATVANVAIPAGAVLAAGGVTLLVLATMSDRPADAHAPPPASLRARPLLGPGLAAVNLEGTF